MDGPIFFKSFLIAIVFLGVIAFAAASFRPGSISTAGQGGGYSNQGSWGGNGGWDGGDDHDDDDD